MTDAPAIAALARQMIGQAERGESPDATAVEIAVLMRDLPADLLAGAVFALVTVGVERGDRSLPETMKELEPMVTRDVAAERLDAILTETCERCGVGFSGNLRACPACGQTTEERE